MPNAKDMTEDQLREQIAILEKELRYKTMAPELRNHPRRDEAVRLYQKLAREHTEFSTYTFSVQTKNGVELEIFPNEFDFSSWEEATLRIEGDESPMTFDDVEDVGAAIAEFLREKCSQTEDNMTSFAQVEFDRFKDMLNDMADASDMITEDVFDQIIELAELDD